jgi:hypothetical protein
MEEMDGVGGEDAVLVDRLAATARWRSCSRQHAREANLVGVLIVSEDLATLSELESLLEHASPYKCRGAAPIGPSASRGEKPSIGSFRATTRTQRRSAWTMFRPDAREAHWRMGGES